MSIGPDTVLRPAPGVVEHPVGVEAVLWHPEQRIPVQLNQSAAVIWWHVDGETPLRQVVTEVAEAFDAPVDSVAQAAVNLCSQLVDQGLLVGSGSGIDPVPTSEQPELLEPRRSAWLNDMALHRVGVAGTGWSIGANTEDALTLVREALGETGVEADDQHPALHATVIDGGDWDVGNRWWLVSAAGYPLSTASDAAILGADVAASAAELMPAQTRPGVAYRLATIHDGAVAHLVQWDLLAARPALEPVLRDGGWRICPTQDAYVDEELHTTADGQLLPVRSALLWTGPGSVETPTTPAAWVWTLSVLAACGPPERAIERGVVVERSAWMQERLALRHTEDAGPSTVVAHLAAMEGAR